jgi:hypothetical protein
MRRFAGASEDDPGIARFEEEYANSPIRRAALKTKMLIDSHCHLDFPDFADELDAGRARATGIARIVTISTQVKRHAGAGAHGRFPHVCCSIGTHPQHAHDELDVGTDSWSRARAIPRWSRSGRLASTTTTIEPA